MDCVIPTSNGFKYFDMNKFVYKSHLEETKLSLDKDLIYHNTYTNRLKRLVILVTNKCNMSCKYCIANRGVYKSNNKNNLLDLKELEKLIYFLLDSYTEGIETIQFFGGEPLLETEHLDKLINCINTIFRNNKRQSPKYSIVTNGTLLNEKVCEFLAKNDIAVTISLDGVQPNHDENRVFPDNTGTYNLIYKNVKSMDSSINKIVEFSISNNCLNLEHPMSAKKIINSFIDMNFGGILANIIYTEDLEPLLCNSDEFVKFLKDYAQILVDYLFQSDCPIFDFKIVNIVIAILTKRKIRNTCTVGVSNLTINSNNEILTCYLDEHILANPNTDINEFKKNQKKYVEVLAPAECRSCWCNNLCSIWCRYMNNGKVIESKCMYNKILVTTILSRLYIEKNNNYSMKNLVNNLKVFTSKYF